MKRALSFFMLPPMEAFLVSAGIVALAEIGDKTQLLAFVLAARYRRPAPIIVGILLATLVNHALAGLLGRLVVQAVGPVVLRYGLAASFVAMAVWILVPDRLDTDEPLPTSRFGLVGTTVIAFFLAEMGDKTQIATVALAARYASVVWVVAGTTVGMLLANVPAVLIGDRLAGRLPTRWIHAIAAAVFAVLGALVWLRPPTELVP
jgi:Ca2+/H+ antiporter, TMEM165/GDT1 family